ncbi:MAG: hypothetical protein Ta2B_15420 [Termitinemataceae bacterium]|nr:MAG: hypothetical protein Ta2B_15420 [Termitinemataceae bacterium]
MCSKYKLGELIKLSDERCGSNYTLDNIKGSCVMSGRTKFLWILVLIAHSCLSISLQFQDYKVKQDYCYLLMFFANH